MKLFLKLLLVLSVAAFAFPAKSYADVSCQAIYGGGQSCVTTNSITINKTVLNPQTNQFVNNLSTNDPKYLPGYITTFQISVTNTGNTNISKVDIKDIFPRYVSFGSGAGNFDAKTNTLFFSITDLAPNETRKYSIVGRVYNTEKISISDGSTVCVVNQAIASIDGNIVGQDNAQFCIQKTIATATTKGGFPVYTAVQTASTPDTGAEALVLFGLIPTGIAGMFLRKNSLGK
jgi:hypothetical protein